MLAAEVLGRGADLGTLAPGKLADLVVLDADPLEVGMSALYLLSDMGKAVTGEVHHVDGGYHVVGMKAEDAPDIAVS